MEKLILSSILSGLLIGLGDVAYVSVESHILGSFLFSLGLLTVVIQGSWLYTGKIGYALNLKPVDLLVTLVFNLISIWALGYLFSITMGLDTSAIVEAKCSETFWSALMRSIGCGMCMWIAVDGWKKFNNPLTIILPVMMFILCGFDHCIANCGYLGMSGVLWSWNLPVWILGNSIGSLGLNYLAKK